MNQIGPYQIISELGRGGMAIVYRALQPSVNRIVALKVLPPHAEGDAESLRRFRREAETAANLTHENIVKVWDASVDSPPYYIAMEFLDGGTLADRLQHGPLPIAEAVGIAAKVCAALGHAHQCGVVHRDVKPANIMFDSNGRPVVTDFGIARATERTQLTAPGAKFGTPNYMSPEQASGMPADRRTDVYSAGAVLYEMVTGKPPFAADDPLTVMYRIVNEEPMPPSAFNPAVSRALEAVVMRALDKDPRRRFQSGSEMSVGLAAAARAPAVSPPATQAGARASMPVPARPTGAKTKRRPLFALVAVISLCAAGALGAVYLSTVERHAPAPVERPVFAPTEGSTSEREAVAQEPPSPAEPAIQDTAAPGTPAGDSPVQSVPGQAALQTATPAEPEQAVAAAPEPAPAPPKVPALVGKTREEAEAALKKVGLTVSRVDQAHHASMPKGRVIGQQPEAGTELSAVGKVTIRLSLGPPPKPPAVKRARTTASTTTKRTSTRRPVRRTQVTKPRPPPPPPSNAQEREVLPP